MTRRPPMSKAAEFVCVGCPIGCPLQLEHSGGEIIEISGYDCKRGAKYARQASSGIYAT